MTRDRIALIGAIAVALVALIGGIILTARGIAVPAWLAGPLALIGTGAAWLVTPPGAADEKDGK